MARASFLLFLLLSTPVGFHHQYTDPGIEQGWKLVHTFFTFAVFFPSLLTFFNVVASLESGARARGGKGLVAWFGKLPWGDPSLAAQVLAMLTFAFGGIGGLINASHSMNLLVHNSMYIVGHFHLTVGTAVTLSFMGITYWLVPVLVGRGLWSRRLALTQVWLWTTGMAMFSYALHSLGLQGMPRRTWLAAATYGRPEWGDLTPLIGIGGAIMFVSAMLYFSQSAADLGGIEGAVPGLGRIRRGVFRAGGRTRVSRPPAAVAGGLRGADPDRLRPDVDSHAPGDLGERAGHAGVVINDPVLEEHEMTTQKDYLGDKLQMVERAREDVYLRQFDRELIAKMWCLAARSAHRGNGGRRGRRPHRDGNAWPDGP